MLSWQNDFLDMQQEHAQVIKILRMSGCTWGRIAEIFEVICHNPEEDWGQVAGKDLVAKAAQILGEDENDWD